MLLPPPRQRHTAAAVTLCCCLIVSAPPAEAMDIAVDERNFLAASELTPKIHALNELIKELAERKLAPLSPPVRRPQPPPPPTAGLQAIHFVVAGTLVSVEETAKREHDAAALPKGSRTMFALRRAETAKTALIGQV